MGENDAYTKLLLHADGTDDAQVFTDSSIGNAVKTGIASPVGGDAYGVFDGTGDYLSIADHADWDFGSGQFTVEAWFKTENSGNQVIVDRLDHANNKRSWTLQMSGEVEFSYSYNGSANAGTITSDDVISDGQWHHVAVVRDSSNDLTMYIDGVAQADSDALSTNSLYATDTNIAIGARNVAHNVNFNGQLDEIRISDTARYTTGFTPQTSNHSSDANTKLLLHMDLPNTDPESFTDSGNTGHSVTQNGNAYQKQASTGIIGTSCGYFDGTGDYLSISDHADWNFGASAFAIEAWIYPLDNSATAVIAGQSADIDNQWYFYLKTSGRIGCEVGDAIVAIISGNDAVIINAWNHVALTNTGSDWKLFANGVIVGSDTDATNPGDYAAALTIGATSAGTLPFTGYMDELRISNGDVRYTANFNPPTTAFTSDANTKLLLHFDAGEGVVAVTDSGNTDHTSNITENGNFIQVIGHGADANGNVKTEDTQKKFGDTAAYFDGNDDFIGVSDSDDFAFGTGSFTIDFWVYFSNFTNAQTLFRQNTAGVLAGNSSDFINFYMAAGGGSINFQCDTTEEGGNAVHWGPDSQNISVTTWTHVAIVRDGNTWYYFVDGVDQAKTLDAGSWSNALPNIASEFGIGGGIDGDFVGYIDELRISKGIARWTSNFTPPTKAYE